MANDEPIRGLAVMADNAREVGMNIYVGSLSNITTKADLRQAFEAYGQVASARVIQDKVNGGSRGFGFVEMPVQVEGHAAIQGLNGKKLKGGPLSVSEVRPNSEGSR